MSGWWGWIGLAVFIAIVRYWPRPPEPEKPRCYGDYPFFHAQEAAERDCGHCQHAYGCHEDSPYTGV